MGQCSQRSNLVVAHYRQCGQLVGGEQPPIVKESGLGATQGAAGFSSCRHRRQDHRAGLPYARLPHTRMSDIGLSAVRLSAVGLCGTGCSADR